MSLNPDRLKEAMFEAERFLKRAKELENLAQVEDGVVAFSYPEAAAVKRSSMDLTRSLAKLRSRN